MGNYTSIVKTGERPTKVFQGSIILFKHCNFKGENITLSQEKRYTKDDIDKYLFDDNSLSSLILGPNTRAILHEFDQFKGKKVVLENPTIDKDYKFQCFLKATNTLTNWTWNDTTSSITLSKINKISLDKNKTSTPDYTVKIKIGNNTYKFNYGTYHHIWLNTNEDDMIIDTYPSDRVRVQLWSGYHPKQGRKTLIDRKRRQTVRKKGIIRSLEVIKVRYLKDKFIKPESTYIGSGEDVAQDYQEHDRIRNERVRRRGVDYNDIRYDDNGMLHDFNTENKITEFFNGEINNNNKIKDFILFLIILTIFPKFI